jgi:hypothetical protein
MPTPIDGEDLRLVRWLDPAREAPEVVTGGVFVPLYWTWEVPISRVDPAAESRA